MSDIERLLRVAVRVGARLGTLVFVMDDPYQLDRFVQAQQADYAQALSELRAGRKRSHWIWYILPQIQGLGSSPLSVRYAIASLDEAQAYLAHPLLGPRLRECVAAISAHDGTGARDMLGDIDARKLQSCLTLFCQAAPADAVFRTALDKYFGGEADAATLAILARQRAAEQ